jgi:hypothetical protein
MRIVIIATGSWGDLRPNVVLAQALQKVGYEVLLIATEPFLAGKLRGLAGEYPVWVDEPVRPQDVPGAIARAFHEAVTGSGPALVIVPMDDWLAEAGAPDERAAPRRVARARGADSRVVAEEVTFPGGEGSISAYLAKMPCLAKMLDYSLPSDHIWSLAGPKPGARLIDERIGSKKMTLA